MKFLRVLLTLIPFCWTIGAIPFVNRPTRVFGLPLLLVWIVVGDRAKVESGIRELNVGEMHLIDADGNAVK